MKQKMENKHLCHNEKRMAKLAGRKQSKGEICWLILHETYLVLTL